MAAPGHVWGWVHELPVLEALENMRARCQSGAPTPPSAVMRALLTRAHETIKDEWYGDETLTTERLRAMLDKMDVREVGAVFGAAARRAKALGVARDSVEAVLGLNYQGVEAMAAVDNPLAFGTAGLAEPEQADPWKHRSSGMKCSTCMWFVPKVDMGIDKPLVVGRCRRHAPTMNGYPVVYPSDWCGDHKLDETKL